MKNKITTCLAAGALFMAVTPALKAQRIMENLDRGTLAIRVNNGIYVNWRLPATEWEGVSYNLYRDGVKVNESPITGATNYLDTAGTQTSTYSVSAIVNGQEQAQSKPVSVWKTQYKEINLKERDSSYAPTEACVGDLDGDGEMEIIVKHLNQDYSEANTKYSYIEAYKLDGTFMWEIDLGPNIVMDSNISLGVFDLDGDGKAEIFMRTSEGTIDGTGVMIPDVGNKDGNMIPDGTINYRKYIGGSGSISFQCAGPEFLSVYEGATGKEIDRVEYIKRGNVSDWGDGYGHRANKFMFGAPYLDGKNPSIMISRGIYTRIVIQTFDFVDGKLKERWTFDTNDNPKYAAQGNHNYVIADVDGDGCDEIVYGSMTVNNDGKGLYTTELGHGDAIHVGNLDPYRKGIEVFQCHEETYGTSLRAAEDGSMLIRHNRTSDTGRCMAGNITDKYPGSEVWGGAQMFSASTRKETTETSGGPENFVIYWDGDLLQEMLDHQGFSSDQGYGTGAIYKFPSASPYFLATGTASSNWTKGVPMLQADILGDWREEVIWRSADMKKIRIYSTTDYTDHRIYTLLHDMQYRQAVCWQNCEYNQPPHASFFLGEAEGILLPPPALIRNGKHLYKGNGSVGKGSDMWVKDGAAAAYAEHAHLLFDEAKDLVLSENLSPATVTFNSKDDFSITGQNVFGGNAKLIKQGLGSLAVTGNHTYSGKTEVWDGTIVIDGLLNNSPVWMNLHTDIYANGEIAKGLLLSYNSSLYIGNKKQTHGELKISESLTAKEGSKMFFDLTESGDQSDILTVNGNLNIEAGALVYAVFPSEPAAGKYELFTISGEITGDLSLVKAICPQRTKGTVSLSQEGNKVYVNINDTRSPGTVVWTGVQNGTWDFASTANFSIDGNAQEFVTGDNVVFDNTGVTRWITIPEIIYPSKVTFEGESSYTLNGENGIGGDAELVKKGTGTLTINNLNPYTGKTSIEGGTVNVQSSLSTTVREGALGVHNSNAGWFNISNGARLSVTAKAVETEQPMTIGEGGANFYCGKQLTIRGSIKGKTLTKLASGDLCLGGKNNTLDTLVVQAGALRMLTEEANGYCASNIVLKNGTYLYALDNSYSTSNSYYSVIVPQGSTATWTLDSRCNYYGKISGKGTLNLKFPYVRSDMEGDATGFEGVINISGSDARLNSTKGFPNAELNIASGVSVYSASTGGSSTKSITMHIGALSGSGKLTGNNTWTIGAKNTDALFSGVISAGKVVKTGSGKQTLSAANTYTGGTTVEQGILEITNASGSGTGTGAVSVTGASADKYGVLDGSGIITGAITVTGYGQIDMTGNNLRTLTVKNLTVNSDNAVLKVEVNPTTLKADKISGTKVAVKGKLVITRTAGKEFAEGNVFKIIDAETVSGRFSSIEGNLPAGLAFDQSMLNTDGTVSVVASTDAGISSADMSEVKVYPTKVTDNIYVRLPQLKGEANIRIFNINGQLITDRICSGGEGEISLDVSSLAPGKYIIRIICDGVNVDRSFVK